MSKAVLVMEMPDVCLNCPCCSERDECLAMDTSSIDVDTRESKPEWCPLKPLPEKKSLTGDTSTTEKMGEELVRVGYNSCLDEILGDSEV